MSPPRGGRVNYFAGFDLDVPHILRQSWGVGAQHADLRRNTARGVWGIRSARRTRTHRSLALTCTSCSLLVRLGSAFCGVRSIFHTVPLPRNPCLRTACLPTTHIVALVADILYVRVAIPLIHPLRCIGQVVNLKLLHGSLHHNNNAHCSLRQFSAAITKIIEK